MRLSGNSFYEGPPARPAVMDQYYAVTQSYTGYREVIAETTEAYVHKHITIDSPAGPVVVDYFETPERNPNLVFVFPVLGGKLFFEKHVATFLAEHGIDAAIVNRSNEFKDPGNFDQLEDIFRLNVVRDRLAIDFFENEQGKKNFGSFGISRGGINVAISAGVDPRLKYNCIVLGGTDLVDLFRDSNQPRIQKYIQSVMAKKHISEDGFFDLLRAQLKTDPKRTAQYIDSRNTLLILGIFDRTVPFSYGMRLRDQIGRPETIFLFADHYVGLLYTQTVSFIPPQQGGGLFPFPYVEQEAVTFFRRSFGDGGNWRILPYRLLQLPFNLVAEVFANMGSAAEWLVGQSASKSEGQEGKVDAYWTGALKEESNRAKEKEESEAAIATATAVPTTTIM